MKCPAIVLVFPHSVSLYSISQPLLYLIPIISKRLKIIFFIYVQLKRSELEMQLRNYQQMMHSRQENEEDLVARIGKFQVFGLNEKFFGC